MSNDLIAQLKALKLHGMAQTLPELMAKAVISELPLKQLGKPLDATCLLIGSESKLALLQK
jgi:hypothetical protein